MYGWLLGVAGSNTLLVKIKILDKKIIALSKKIHNKDTATYMCKNFVIEEIINESLEQYNMVDIPILQSEIKIKFMRGELGINYENVHLIVYLNKIRALEDLYLFNNKASGDFLEYSKSGKLICKIILYKGKLLNSIDY